MTDQGIQPAITLMGAGKMGFAMLESWTASGLAGEKTTIIEPGVSEQLKSYCSKHGLILNPPDLIQQADILVLAIKPQMLDAAAPAINALTGPETLVISILAGKSIADIAARVPGARAIVRAMPNTPAAIGRGITGLAASPAVTARQRAVSDQLLGATGAVEWLEDEALMDAVTAVSGSGPAYVFLLAEVLAEAGCKIGLPADLAMRLARATIAGSGEMMRQQPDVPPSKMRENVTSPGGTTAAALDVLRGKDGLQALMARAVVAASARARALSG